MMKLRILKRCAAVLSASAFLAAAFFCVSGLARKARPAMVNTCNLPCVILDAGHGGFDGGASGADGTLEKELNLVITQKLRTLLTALGFETVMVRETDTSVNDGGESTVRDKKRSDLKNRLALMGKYPNCVYLCVHQNYFPQTQYSGTQIFYAPNGDDSLRLAQELQSSVKLRLQPENVRKIKPCTKDVYIIYRATAPAVLVECGFLSNPGELARLKTEEYQNQLAFSLACGLLGYVRSGRSTDRSAAVLTQG